MNYEIKSVSPWSLFLNTVRIFLIIGLIEGIYYFFIMNNPNFQIPWWQKFLATLLFTVVFAGVVSAFSAFMGWLYNVWAGKYKGIRVRLEQQP